MRRLLVPDFLGIGAMRSGTTWLTRRLREHPDVWMSRRKEVHFFDRRLDEGRIDWLPSWEARLRYGAFFIEGRLRGRSVTGEITPEYAVLPPERIALVHRWMPDLKLIYLMREPIERAWSHLRKNVSEQRAIGADPSIDEMLRFLDHPDVVARSDYIRCIEAWQQHYPPERFLFLFLEEIEQSPAEVLRTVHEFLGVDPAVSVDPGTLRRRENARDDDGMPDVIRAHLEAQLGRDPSALEALVGRPVPWRS